MKLHFYGTGASEGFPALFCQCENCARARKLGGKNIRTRASLGVDEELLIDFSQDTYSHCLYGGLDLTKIRHVLITHSHSDHFCPADSAITFPPAGEMLEVECEPFAPLDDDGSREVTVQYYFADGTEVSASYDLSAGETRDEAEEPVIAIQRDWSTGAGVMHTSAPVTAQEDRDWILDAISSADFQPMRELPGYCNLVLFVEEDGETVSYGVCSDGTLFWEDANGNAEFAAEALDYLKLSALTYKYAGRASHIGGYLPEGWLLSVQLEQRAEIPEEIAAV